jgi:hypothetical protein
MPGCVVQIETARGVARHWRVAIADGPKAIEAAKKAADWQEGEAIAVISDLTDAQLKEYGLEPGAVEAE